MAQRNLNRRAGTVAAKRGAQQHKSKRQTPGEAPDMTEVLGRFSDALSLLAVVQRSLSMQEFSGIGDEELTLRRAIDDLKSVYDEIDSAIPHLESAAAVRLAPSDDDDYK